MLERFAGQQLRASPHIAVLFYDSIGDFVVVTPLLRGLREKYPECVVDYFGGERTRELEEASELVDSRYSLFGATSSIPGLHAYVASRLAAAGPYDLAINCEFHPLASTVTAELSPRYVVGGCYAPDGRDLLASGSDPADKLQSATWTDANFLEQFAGVLESNFIGEIFCRMARVETDYHRTTVPVANPFIEVPPILISTGASRSAKLWEEPYWECVIRHCESRGLAVGLIGGSPEAQAKHYHSASTESRLLARTPLIDLRGTMTLPQVAGALSQARVCITIDNGIMHLAAAVGTPTIAIFGASAWQLWAPRLQHLQVLLPEVNCTLCREHNFRNNECLRSEHVCMLSVRPETVIDRLERILYHSDRSNPSSYVTPARPTRLEQRAIGRGSVRAGVTPMPPNLDQPEGPFDGVSG